MVFEGDLFGVKIYDNKKWLLVFYHNCTGKNYFENEEQALYSTDPNKYSILSRINSKHKIRNKYEFIIYWQQLDSFYHWRQSTNPIYDLEKEGVFQVEGLEMIHPTEIKEEQYEFGGLVKTTIPDVYNNSLLNGVPGNLGWYFAIGMYQKSKQHYYNRGIPTTYDITTQIVSLWLCVQQNSTCQSRIILFKPHLIYLFITIS